MMTDDTLAMEDTIGFLLWDANRAFNQAFSKRIARHGLSFGEFPFLRVLWEEEGLSQREISDRVRMRGPTTVGAINRLEQKGLVKRVRNPDDARKIDVRLTEKGRALRALAMPDVKFVNELGLTGLNDKQRDQIRDFLRRMRDNMKTGASRARRA